MDQTPAWLQNIGAMMPPDQAQINNAVLADGTPMSIAAPPMPQPQAMQSAAMQRPMPAQPAAAMQMSPAFQKYLPPKQTASQADQTNAYGTLSKQALADQAATVSGLNQYIDDIAAKPRGVDLSALAAYVDSTTGSKLYDSVHAAAPMSQEAKDQMLFGLKNKAAVDQAKLSADQLKALQEQQAHEQYLRHEQEVERHNAAMESNQAANGQGGRVGVMLGNQAIAAGKEFEHDPIIKSSKESLNSLIRSVSILDNPNKPVTAKDMNLAYNDYINAVAKGGAATEGKISRELPESYELKYNELKQRFGENDDIRKDKAGAALVELLRQNIHTVRHDLNGAIGDQAQMIKDNYGAVNNPMVHQTVDAKLAAYNKYINSPQVQAAAIATPHPQDSEAVTWAKANSSDPRAQAILKMNGGN